MKILIVTILGGRTSIAQKHLDSLFKAIDELQNNPGFFLNVVVYITNFNNSSLHDLCFKYVMHNNIIFLSKTAYSEISSTLDYDYDFIMENFLDSFEYFLLLHDDTFVDSKLLLFTFRSLKKYDVVSFLDSNRSLHYYKKVLIDGIPLSDFRLGTWFFSASRKTWDDRVHGFGCGSFFSKKQLLDKFNNNRRLSIQDKYLWLNGGALFNLTLKLQNKKILILDYVSEIENIYHFNAAVNIFIKSKWLSYELIDCKNEFKILKDNFLSLKKSDRLNVLFSFEKLIEKFDGFKIKDNLVNNSNLKILQSFKQSEPYTVPLTQIQNSEPKYVQIKFQRKHKKIQEYLELINQIKLINIKHIILDIDKNYTNMELLTSILNYSKSKGITITIVLDIFCNNIDIKLIKEAADYLIFLITDNLQYPNFECLESFNKKSNSNSKISFVPSQQLKLKKKKNINTTKMNEWKKYPLFKINEKLPFKYEFVYGCEFNFYKDGIFINDELDYVLCPFDEREMIFLGNQKKLSVEEYITHDMRKTTILRIEGGSQDIFPCHYCYNKIT